MKIREKRLKAMYDFSRNNEKESLALLLAMISHHQIKQFCEHFNLKV